MPGAAITEMAPIQNILDHLGEPHEPPALHPPRGPPDWIDADEHRSSWMKISIRTATRLRSING
jgi:hypothetical protein